MTEERTPFPEQPDNQAPETSFIPNDNTPEEPVAQPSSPDSSPMTAAKTDAPSTPDEAPTENALPTDQEAQVPMASAEAPAAEPAPEAQAAAPDPAPAPDPSTRVEALNTEPTAAPATAPAATPAAEPTAAPATAPAATPNTEPTAAPAATPTATATAAPAPTAAPAETATATTAAGKKKKTVTIVIVAAVAAVLAFILFSTISGQQAKAEYNAYVDKLEDVRATMFDGAWKAEQVGDKVHDIWYSAIWEDRKSDWDSDIRQYYSTDFNEAVMSYLNGSEGRADVAEVLRYQKDVEEGMKELQNPPEGCETAYLKISSIYSDYNRFCDLVTDPTGSLSTFTNTFNDLDTNLADSFGSLTAIIPSKK